MPVRQKYGITFLEYGQIIVGLSRLGKHWQLTPTLKPEEWLLWT